jgi:hypothetical protein
MIFPSYGAFIFENCLAWQEIQKGYKTSGEGLALPTANLHQLKACGRLCPA